MIASAPRKPVGFLRAERRDKHTAPSTPKREIRTPKCNKWQEST